jgi:uncharacterized protein (UPF0332 family)
MDSKLFIHRAENEVKLAGIIMAVSEDTDMQKEMFMIHDPETYFSAVIAHSYYSIFYGAKAYLADKGISVSAPEEHKKAFMEFERFVKSGELDVELLKIYEKAMMRADNLLGIFREEKKKRGEFTYRIMPQANQEPASESIGHARVFLKHMIAVLQK